MHRLAAALLSVATGWNGAMANERSAQLVNSFQVFCTLEKPDFAALNAKAAGMRLQVHQEIGERTDGDFAHSKSWFVPLKSGPHELAAAEARSSKGEVATCGIAAPDVPGEDMKQDLAKAMKLDGPLRETMLPDGKRMTTWKWADMMLILADGTPKNVSGAYVTLLNQITPSH